MGGFGLRRFYRLQRRTLPPPEAVDDVSSKTIMVTGSNVGLGFEASVHLAKLGPKLLVTTSRDLAKCEQTRKSVLERAGVSGASSPEVFAWPLDLGSFRNICSFVNRLAEDEKVPLNALVANAGVLGGDYTQTQDGWEVTLQVNYLSTVLLCILLLPFLINSSSPDSPSRLVVVSSFAHFFAKDVKQAESWSNILDTLNQRGFGDSTARYTVSKLLELAFIRELASRLPEPTPVVTCAVDPGYCESQIFRSWGNKWLIRISRKLLFMRSAEEGSRTLVHAAVATDRSMHGRYLASCQVVEESDLLLTPKGKAFSARIWDETITVLSGVDGRVSEIVEKYLRLRAG